MGTYTGTTPAKRGMSEKIWLALITFVAASAIVLALVGVQRGGSTSPATVVRPAAPPSVVINHSTGDTPIVSNTIVTKGRFQGHPLP